MKCPKCSQDCPSGQFCPNCGGSLTTGYGSGLFQEIFYQGTMKSDHGEIWEYSKGDIKCLQGGPRGSAYQWNGTTVTGDGPFKGTGSWTPSSCTVTWRFSGQSVDFWNYIWESSAKRWKNTSGIQRYEPLIYTSFVHWVVKGDMSSGAWGLEIEEGSEKKEGCATSWDIQGDIPPPVACIIANHSLGYKLHEEVLLRAKRIYKRCNKLVLTNTSVPQVCKNCFTGKDRCIECDQELTGAKIPPQMCKACTIKKNFCIRCGDALRNAGSKAYLCESHGYGREKNCAKMTFSNRPDQ